MFFLPIGCLIFTLFFLSLPFLFGLVFFKIITFGFGNLGFSSEATFLILLLILLGSAINIPLTRRKIVPVERFAFFGLIKKKRFEKQGVYVNFGGAIIPLVMSLYFLTRVPSKPVLIASFLMIVICWGLSRVVPGRGITLPALVPPLFSALIALMIAPGFAAPTAFISGVAGTLIGADFLKIRKAQRISPGMLSIGGAGVFDGIFLVGIASAFLTGF